jgi:hypothetical protein
VVDRAVDLFFEFGGGESANYRTAGCGERESARVRQGAEFALGEDSCTISRQALAASSRSRTKSG